MPKGRGDGRDHRSVTCAVVVGRVMVIDSYKAPTHHLDRCLQIHTALSQPAGLRELSVVAFAYRDVVLPRPGIPSATGNASVGDLRRGVGRRIRPGGAN